MRGAARCGVGATVVHWLLSRLTALGGCGAASVPPCRCHAAPSPTVPTPLVPQPR